MRPRIGRRTGRPFSSKGHHPLIVKLTEACEQRGIKQEVLAMQSGVSPDTMRVWRTRRGNPGLLNFLAALNAIGLDLAIVEKETP